MNHPAASGRGIKGKNMEPFQSKLLAIDPAEQ
jgi:hypothetical protein